MDTIKLQAFAERLEREQLERLMVMHLNCEANINSKKVTTKAGKKFTKIDVGTCGKFMVENETGNIFGIKGYGVVHRGHWYGTLDTVDDYNWGGYYPKKKVNPTPLQTCTTIPKLTFAPAQHHEAWRECTCEIPWTGMNKKCKACNSYDVNKS